MASVRQMNIIIYQTTKDHPGTLPLYAYIQEIPLHQQVLVFCGVFFRWSSQGKSVVASQEGWIYNIQKKEVLQSVEL